MHLSLCACLSVWSPTGVSRVMSPEQVGADVLRHLLDVAAQYLGHSQVNCDVQICDLRDLCATNGGCFDYLVTKSQGSLLDLCINVLFAGEQGGDCSACEVRRQSGTKWCMPNRV